MPLSMASWLGSSASSGNPSLAWSMGCGGKGHITIEFPFALMSGWYHEQPCTTFRALQHRKERKGLRHEFIVLKLLDGSICRIERTGDPSARFNALSPQGSVARDMAQCFRPHDIDQARLDSSYVIAELTLPCEFEIKDVLKICRAIHEGEKTRNYTLQVYNCYFFTLAIQSCLTRLVAHWEDKNLLWNWLLQVNRGIDALTDTFNLLATSSWRNQLALFRIYSALVPPEKREGCIHGKSLVEEIKLMLQLRITGRREAVHYEILHRINNLLWYSNIGLGLDQFIEEHVKAAVMDIFRGRISKSVLEPSQLLTPGYMKNQLLLTLSHLMASTGIHVDSSAVLSSRQFSCIKQKLLHIGPRRVTQDGELGVIRRPEEQIPTNVSTGGHQWILLTAGYITYIGTWLLQAVLDFFGVALLLAPGTNESPLACVVIDEKLNQVANDMETLELISFSDLRRLNEEMSGLVNNEAATWDESPWANINHCIKRHISVGLLGDFQTNKPKIRFQTEDRTIPEDVDISVFQLHVLDRIEIQAKEVEGVWLGSSSKIRRELEDMLSQVWSTIREDHNIVEKASRAHLGNSHEQLGSNNFAEGTFAIKRLETQFDKTSELEETLPALERKDSHRDELLSQVEKGQVPKQGQENHDSTVQSSTSNDSLAGSVVLTTPIEHSSPGMKTPQVQGEAASLPSSNNDSGQASESGEDEHIGREATAHVSSASKSYYSGQNTLSVPYGGPTRHWVSTGRSINQPKHDMSNSWNTPYKVELACTTLTTVAALISYVVPPTLHLNLMLDMMRKDVLEILGLTRTSQRQELKEFGGYVERMFAQVVSTLRCDGLAAQPNVLKNLEELQKTLCLITHRISHLNASGGLMSRRRYTVAPEVDHVGQMRRQLDDATSVFQYGVLVELLGKSPDPPSGRVVANPYTSQSNGPHYLSAPPTEDHPRTNGQHRLQSADSNYDSRSSNAHPDTPLRAQRDRSPRETAATSKSSGPEAGEILVARMKVDSCRRSFHHSRSATGKMELAVALEHLSRLLTQAGQTGEALAISRESVELYRSLAEVTSSSR